MVAHLPCCTVVFILCSAFFKPYADIPVWFTCLYLPVVKAQLVCDCVLSQLNAKTLTVVRTTSKAIAIWSLGCICDSLMLCVTQNKEPLVLFTAETVPCLVITALTVQHVIRWFTVLGVKTSKVLSRKREAHFKYGSISHIATVPIIGSPSLKHLLKRTTVVKIEQNLPDYDQNTCYHCSNLTFLNHFTIDSV